MKQSGGSQTAPEASPRASGSGHQDEDQPKEPAAPPKGWPLWVWPPVAIALIAVAGYKLGIAGALTAAAAAVAALIFVAGDVLYSGERRRPTVVVALSLAVIILVALLWQAKVPWIRLRVTPPAPTPGPVDLRGATVTQAQATKLNFRGAELSGAVLNWLSLRGKPMEGVTAPGASFRHANLSFASLRGADLSGSDLSYACLIGTIFTGATLNGADVSHALLNLHQLPHSGVKRLRGVPVKPRRHHARCPVR